MHREKIARYRTVVGMPQWNIIGDPDVDRMILLKRILKQDEEDQN